VSAEAQLHRLLELVCEPLDVLARIAPRCDVVRARIVPVPVLHDPDLLTIRDEVAARRDLVDSLEQRTIRRVRDEVNVVKRVAIPCERHTEIDECLYLGREVEVAIVDRVVERLDAEAIASGEQYLVALIPDRECELAAQRMNRAGALLLEQVQRDLAVGPRTERVSLLLELAADPLEVIELAIRDDVKPLVFVRD